jgi:hypothetical protein
MTYSEGTSAEIAATSLYPTELRNPPMPAKKASTTPNRAPKMVVDTAQNLAKSSDFQERMYQAISVQRPIVLAYLRSLRRDKPDATAAELLQQLDNRYIAAITAASTGVGASAAIPAVGIPLAIGLGVADLLFFYETSALYVLAVAELHGVAVTDVERARPLVLGMLLGQKSQVQISGIVLAAVGAGGAAGAAGVVGKALPSGWGQVLTEQLPDSALVPVATVIARETLKTSAKLGAGTVGKVIPFGVGAVVGGLGSFFFGREVTKATRIAFPESPTAFPEWLEDYAKSDGDPEPPRAVIALQEAATRVKDLSGDIWDKVGAAADVFRPIDRDGDGIPEEARAVSAAKAVGSKAADVAGSIGDRAAGLLRSRRSRKPSTAED